MDASFYQKIIEWYDCHKRDLPWRTASSTSYEIWLSEIMLQQTVVKTVIPYFYKFLHKWPNFYTLSQASMDEVLYMWQGLGYYSRARNLLVCAQKIVSEYGGDLPQSDRELLSLPGVGPYTASAIAAIAFNQKVSVIDGNIVRVLSRVFEVKAPYPQSRKNLDKIYLSLVGPRSGDFAQALMDVSQELCRPQNPKCDLCPVKSFCSAFQNNLMEMYPVKSARPLVKTIKSRAFVIVNEKGEILMSQRPKKGLLGGLYDIPTFPGWDSQSGGLDIFQLLPKGDLRSAGHISHKFTHLSVTLEVFVALLREREFREPWFWGNYENYALSRLMQKAIQKGLSEVHIRV